MLDIIFNIRLLGLCPNTPFHIAGTRIEPKKSEPTPKSDAPAPNKAP